MKKSTSLAGTVLLVAFGQFMLFPLQQ